MKIKLLMNRYDLEKLQELNETLGYNLTTDLKEIGTLKDAEYDLEHLLSFPFPMVYLTDKMFKNNWKDIPKILKRTDKARVFYNNPNDYIVINTKNEIVQMALDGASKIILSIYQDIKNPNKLSWIDKELTTWWKSQNKNPQQLLNYYNDYLDKSYNKSKIDIIFENFETSTTLFRELQTRTTPKEIYKVKLLYILYFKQTQDITLLRKFNIYEDTDEYNIDTLISLIQQFLKVKIDKEQIVNRVETVTLEERQLDLLQVSPH